MEGVNGGELGEEILDLCLHGSSGPNMRYVWSRKRVLAKMFVFKEYLLS